VGAGVVPEVSQDEVEEGVVTCGGRLRAGKRRKLLKSQKGRTAHGSAHLRSAEKRSDWKKTSPDRNGLSRRKEKDRNRKGFVETR